MKIIQYPIAVIGGGLAGCLVALELANKGYKLCLIESKERLLEGASNSTLGRIDLGFQNVHKETAIICLHSTIQFVKRYKDFVKPLMIGSDKAEKHSLRCGRYFITEDSLLSKEELLPTYTALQEEYRRLCKEDISNQIFGNPDNFFRILDPSEYEADVSKKIICGIETAEHLLNWPLLRNFVIDEMEKNKNIKVFLEEEVKTVGFDIETNKHVLFCYKRKELDLEIYSALVVNCAWENIGKITKTAKFLPESTRKMPQGNSKQKHATSESRRQRNRIKGIVEVKLPESLKDAHSMSFHIGADCIFSNMGDGRGILTDARITSIRGKHPVPTHIDIFLHFNSSDKLSGGLRKEMLEYGNTIIENISTYIPEMSQAKLSSVIFYPIVTNDNVDMVGSNRDIMFDDYPLGWINHTCMRLPSAYRNAVFISKIVDEQIGFMPLVFEKAEELAIKGCDEGAAEQPFSDKTKALAFTLYRYFSSSELIGRKDAHRKMSFENSKSLILAAMNRKLLINAETLNVAKLKLKECEFPQEVFHKIENVF